MASYMRVLVKSSKRQSLTFCAAAIALLAMIPAACKRPAPEPSAPLCSRLYRAISCLP